MVHAEATSRVADYYRRQGLLVSVDGCDEPEAIFARTLALLAAQKLRAHGLWMESTRPSATV
jgi:hypothetical protein